MTRIPCLLAAAARAAFVAVAGVALLSSVMVSDHQDDHISGEAKNPIVSAEQFIAADGEDPKRRLGSADGAASKGMLNLTATAFLGGTTALYGEASPTCIQCCSAGQCQYAYQGSQAGTCCMQQPAMCCPIYATCAQNGCMKQNSQYGGGYGAQNGGQYGNGYGGYSFGGGSPIQQLFRWVNSHMTMIWFILMILGCLGIGGPCVHYLQMALCGMSMFNMLAPQGAQNDMYGYGPPGYGQPGGF